MDEQGTYITHHVQQQVRKTGIQRVSREWEVRRGDHHTQTAKR